MAYSQNGRRVLESYGGPLVSTVIPGTDGVRYLGGILSGDINTIAMYVGYRWHTEIERLDGAPAVTGMWGYNYRPIRGQSDGFSNHASGSAWDTWAARHPLGTRTLSQRQLDVLRGIAKALRNVVRFGAFYTGRPDEMHAETVGTDDEIAAVARDIRNGTLPNVPAELIVERAPEKPTPEPQPVPADTEPNLAKEYDVGLYLFTSPAGNGAIIDGQTLDTNGENAALVGAMRSDWKAAGSTGSLADITTHKNVTAAEFHALFDQLSRRQRPQG